MASILVPVTRSLGQPVDFDPKGFPVERKDLVGTNRDRIQGCGRFAAKRADDPGAGSVRDCHPVECDPLGATVLQCECNLSLLLCFRSRDLQVRQNNIVRRPIVLNSGGASRQRPAQQQQSKDKGKSGSSWKSVSSKHSIPME